MCKLVLTLGLSAVVIAVGCTGVDEVRNAHSTAEVRAQDSDDDDEGDSRADEDIDLAAVPELVKRAAQAAVPGIVLTEAEKETERGVLIYSLEGTADGKVHEIEVTADGHVLEIESSDDSDDADDE